MTATPPKPSRYRVIGWISFDIRAEHEMFPDEESLKKYIESKLCLCQHNNCLEHLELLDEGNKVEEVYEDDDEDY